MIRIFYIVFMLMGVFAGKAFAQKVIYVPHIVSADGAIIPLAKEGAVDSTGLVGLWTVKGDFEYKKPVSIIISPKETDNRRVSVFDTSETLLEHIDPDYLQKAKDGLIDTNKLGTGKKPVRLVCLSTVAPGDPLLLVDGVEKNIKKLEKIKPENIQKIQVLKDVAATAVYGIKASHGVIIITTKNKKKKN
ncbi:TonB-dependent receptor plug domain-containing protein [Mucilaginibacter sp. JRF]|uniref:TonB-dependent receptor plug domain-containing protein n=1 Tax=Mucilaginibacter sp. JRF TaxID=2780088 RepID=UPI00187F91FE|nr:TonB-dependent receptor plug domain-containing protein [Mucilaginibacter sp. JRF]MBE9584394.1 TonB-dependent receptor plug domain-containing protein [Mucilaginibacter sp. JRF]